MKIPRVDVQHATLRDLAADPAVTVWRPVAGGSWIPASIDSAVHVRRLLDWAGTVGLPEHTEVTGGGRIPTPMRPQNPNFGRPTHGVPALAMPSGQQLGTCGWALTLRPSGQAEREVRLFDEGRIVDEGTAAQRDGAWAAHAAAQKEARIAAAEAGDARTRFLTRLARARADRDAAQYNEKTADDEWRSVIREIMAARESGEVTIHVDEIARIAGLSSRERVYQIRDGRR
jgi:hypothetical protein